MLFAAIFVLMLALWLWSPELSWISEFVSLKAISVVLDFPGQSTDPAGYIFTGVAASGAAVVGERKRPLPLHWCSAVLDQIKLWNHTEAAVCFVAVLEVSFPLTKHPAVHVCASSLSKAVTLLSSTEQAPTELRYYLHSRMTECHCFHPRSHQPS